MLTDQDLTAALHGYADRNAPDTAAVRAAIEHDIAAGSSGGLNGSTGRGAPGGRRPLVLLAVAACTLALVGLGLVVARARQSSPQASGRSSAAPSQLPLPDIGTLTGTRLVGSFAGTGPGTVRLPVYAIPSGFELSAFVGCQGAGGLKVYTDDAGSYLSSGGCGTGSVGSSLPSRQASLRVVVAASARWRIALAVTPKTRTNGSMQSPPSSALAKPTASGRGTASFRAPAGITISATVELTCVGTGVSLTSANHRFDGNYTHTCFAGHSYVFRITRPDLPTTVTVHADANTTWRLVLLDY